MPHSSEFKITEPLKIKDYKDYTWLYKFVQITI